MIIMFEFTRRELDEISDKSEFNRDNLEKVIRLIDVLTNITKENVFKKLVLKGGTALQLSYFNFKRLSVDIDFDYNSNEDKNDVLIARNLIKNTLIKQMQVIGYSLSNNSKFTYSLDSFIFNYTNLAGNNDNLKIEINYTNRVHVFDPEIKEFKSDILGNVKFLTLSKLELFSTKINALLTRTVPRDVYDYYLIITKGAINADESSLLKKLILFYLSISTTKNSFSTLIDNFKSKLNNLNYYKIKKTLIPVLSKNHNFNIDVAKKHIIESLDKLLILSENEEEYFTLSRKGIFNFDLLFDDQISNSLSLHPRVLWIKKSFENN